MSDPLAIPFSFSNTWDEPAIPVGADIGEFVVGGLKAQLAAEFYVPAASGDVIMNWVFVKAHQNSDWCALSLIAYTLIEDPKNISGALNEGKYTGTAIGGVDLVAGSSYFSLFSFEVPIWALKFFAMSAPLGSYELHVKGLINYGSVVDTLF